MMLGEQGQAGIAYLQNVLAPRVVQIMFIIGMVLYALFALVILKQTKVMSQTIEGRYNQAVSTFAWLHLLMTILLVILAIVYL